MRPSSTADAQVALAGPLDGPVIAALQNESFPRERWSQGSVATLLGLPGSIAFLASGRTYGETMPLAYVMARVAGDEAEILSLGVLPEARRHGLARRLMEAATARARSLGARRMHLEVAAGNAAALALYRGLDFAEVGRRPGYYTRDDGSREDALLLARALEPAEG